MRGLTRREALELIVAASAASTAGCSKPSRGREGIGNAASVAAGGEAVLAVTPLGSPPWKTQDPFLFCVHHDDKYPAGNEQLGPAASLAGRNIGQDFEGIDGWRMYHGDVVPGFPQHPHRGFETVTVVRNGLLDHSDSLGAAARYGSGDVQWLTAGSGIIHAEMFPLLERHEPNPVELFQIWLNLPSSNKMVEPHFSMLWSKVIPRHRELDAAGRATDITLVAGHYARLKAPAPPPRSWASQAGTDVSIWTLRLAPHASFRLPAAARGAHRTLYFFRGSGLRVGGHAIAANHQIELRPELEVSLQAGANGAEILLLGGRPIGEPVAKHGPFVMNTENEIRQAYSDFRQTQFGGWPWQRRDPVHPRDQGRFARHADGRVEQPS